MSGPMSGDPSPEFWRGRSVAVTGGAGFLGKPTVCLLEELGASVRVIRSAEHDLRVRDECAEALGGAEVVIHLAATVGGIGFNRRNPGPLARDNLLMAVNVYEACRELAVGKLVSACSVCAYPHDASPPFREDDIWHGYPEESNAPYGIAKRTLLMLADSYRRQWGLDSSVPVLTNLYGPADNFGLEDSHVIAAMIRRYADAVAAGERRVTQWGSGRPTRDFLYVDDAARALVLCVERSSDSRPFNIATGRETAVSELAGEIAELSGFDGETAWDASRPDGQARRALDVSRARGELGFEARIGLRDGLSRTVEWFREFGAEATADRPQAGVLDLET